MANLFRGYIPADGKRPLYSVKTFQLLPEPPAKGDYVGALHQDIIQVDVDDMVLATKVLTMVQEMKLRCDVLKTSRGYHFYFKNTIVKSQSVHYYSACGIPCDYGLGSKDRVVPLRMTKVEEVISYVEGEEIKTNQNVTTQREWLQTYSEVEELPCWLLPISNKDKGVMEITSRNQSLFNYILVLQQHGLNKDEIRKTIKVINKYILENALSDKEIDTITRDEAFSDEIFFGEKGQFYHDLFGNYLLTNAHVLNINNQCHIYTKNHMYSNKVDDFERIMLGKIPKLKDTQRKEVYKYMALQCQKEGSFADPKFIALKDSILDLETKQELPYSPNIVINNRIKYEYKADAYHELMDKTLNKVCCNDKQIRCLLEEMLGYTLYRANTMQVAFILTGEGSNGKSTILNLVKKLLGKENYTSLDLRELEENFKPAELYNKLANLGDDISAKYLENSSVFKKCVTGESFMVAYKYGQPFELESYATQIFCANELPQVSDKSDGFMRRIVIVPFNAKFSKSDPDYDPFIESKLLTDEAMQYLLKISIEGLMRVITNKEFSKSDVGEQEKQQYMKLNNNVLEWLDTEPKIENESVNDVYRAYQVWCANNGCNYVKKLNLSKEVKKIGFVSKPRRVDGVTIRVYEKEEE